MKLRMHIGPLSRIAVNYNIKCSDGDSRDYHTTIFNATFPHTPLVVLASIIMSAVLGLIDYKATVHH